MRQRCVFETNPDYQIQTFESSANKPYWHFHSIGCNETLCCWNKISQAMGQTQNSLPKQKAHPQLGRPMTWERERGEWCLSKWVLYGYDIFHNVQKHSKEKKCTKIIISSYYTKEIKHQWQCIRQMIFQEHTHTHTRKRIIKRYKLHIAHSSLMTFSNVRKLCKITKKINLLIPSLIVWIYCILLSCYDGSGTSKSKIRSMLTHGGYLSHIVPKLTKKHLLTSSVALESNH